MVWPNTSYLRIGIVFLFWTRSQSQQWSWPIQTCRKCGLSAGSLIPNTLDRKFRTSGVEIGFSLLRRRLCNRNRHMTPNSLGKLIKKLHTYLPTYFPDGKILSKKWWYKFDLKCRTDIGTTIMKISTIADRWLPGSF